MRGQFHRLVKVVFHPWGLRNRTTTMAQIAQLRILSGELLELLPLEAKMSILDPLHERTFFELLEMLCRQETQPLQRLGCSFVHHFAKKPPTYQCFEPNQPAQSTIGSGHVMTILRVWILIDYLCCRHTPSQMFSGQSGLLQRTLKF